MAEKTFYVCVVQYDMNADDAKAKGYDPPDGPLLMEHYLQHFTTYEAAEKASARWTSYGWCRVGKLTVDIPGEE